MLPCYRQNLWVHNPNIPFPTIKLEPGLEREQKLFCNLYFKKKSHRSSETHCVRLLIDTCPSWDGVSGKSWEGLGDTVSPTWARVSQNYLEDWLKHQGCPPTPVSNRALGGADATCPGTKFWELPELRNTQRLEIVVKESKLLNFFFKSHAHTEPLFSLLNDDNFFR